MRRRRVCGVHPPVRALAAGAVRWTKGELLWEAKFDLPGINSVNVERAFLRALTLWAAASKLRFRQPRWLWLRWRMERPDIFARVGQVDGAGNALAWSYMPDGNNSPVEQRYDYSEEWALGPLPWNSEYVDLQAVMCHEVGHALGLDHSDNDNDLMAPYYDVTIREPQANDLRRMEKLYGG